MQQIGRSERSRNTSRSARTFPPCSENSTRLVVGSARYLVRPQFAVLPYRALGWFTLAFRRGTVTVREGRRVDPGLKSSLIAPACDHQPGRPVVRGLEQFEALEPLLIVHSSRSCGEPVGQFVSAVGGHRNRVDLDDSHPAMMAGVRAGRRRPSAPASCRDLRCPVHPAEPKLRARASGPVRFSTGSDASPRLQEFARRSPHPSNVTSMKYEGVARREHRRRSDRRQPMEQRFRTFQLRPVAGDLKPRPDG
jgi:hypothetical protein